MPTIDIELRQLKNLLEEKEEFSLAPRAIRSRAGYRRQPELRIDDHRLTFALDADRILHSRAYSRYIDKTQVFYLIANDHITHRVLHVQLVSKIARTIGRFLALNEDLIEAIALGHDIGHPPFGHDGESILSRLCREQGLPPFQHNIQSVRFLEQIERDGSGWNLTLQTLDGILCHDGEIHNRRLEPLWEKDFAGHDREIGQKALVPATALRPMSLEGCVVRFADTISYIGRDIEDAIDLGLIRREEIPPPCQELLGNSNGSIVYRLVRDVIAHSHGQEAISFSAGISEVLHELKLFNYERIYRNPKIKEELPAIENCYRLLFATYLEQLRQGEPPSPPFHDFLATMVPAYREREPHAALVRDFLAGMTDDYFLAQAKLHGATLPRRR